jgi:hypothetical protein
VSINENMQNSMHIVWSKTKKGGNVHASHCQTLTHARESHHWYHSSTSHILHWFMSILLGLLGLLLLIKCFICHLHCLLSNLCPVHIFELVNGDVMSTWLGTW